MKTTFFQLPTYFATKKLRKDNNCRMRQLFVTNMQSHKDTILVCETTTILIK